jgi:hypothetical protein
MESDLASLRKRKKKQTGKDAKIIELNKYRP